jgi:hypothetical protein
MTGNNQITVEDIAWCDKLQKEQISALEEYFDAIKKKISSSDSSNELDDQALIDRYRILADKPEGGVQIDEAKAYFKQDKYPQTNNDELQAILYLKCHRLKDRPDGGQFEKIEKGYVINHENNASLDRRFKVVMGAIFVAGIIAAPFTAGISLVASGYAVGAFSYYTAATKALDSSQNKKNQAMSAQIGQESIKNGDLLPPPVGNQFERRINIGHVKSNIELVARTPANSHNNNSNHTEGPKQP